MEINYAAAAYDELNMCKSRLRACHPDMLEEDDGSVQSKLTISEYEVDFKREEFEQEYAEAQTKFVRIQGTLKYLRHLDKKSGPLDVCPICSQVPEFKVGAYDYDYCFRFKLCA